MTDLEHLACSVSYIVPKEIDVGCDRSLSDFLRANGWPTDIEFLHLLAERIRALRAAETEINLEGIA